METHPREFIRVLYQDVSAAKSRIGNLKATADIGSITKIAKLLPKPPHPLTAYFYGIPWHRTLDSLFNKKTQVHTGQLVAELQWAAIAMSYYAADLNGFFQLRQKCECELLRGDYERAAATHGSIEKQWGVSLWSLQTQFFLLESMNGLEANTRRLSELNSQKDFHFFLQVLVNFLSMRAERQLSHENYQHKLAKYMSSYDEYPQLKYFLEQTTGREPIQFESFNEALVVSILGNGSLIDRCLYIITLLQRLYAAAPADSEVLRPCLQLMGTSLSMAALRNLQAAVLNTKITEVTSVDIAIVQALDCYTAGDYQGAADLTAKLLTQLPTAIQLYELYVKALIFAGRPLDSPFSSQAPGHEALLAINSVFRKSTDYPQSLDILLRLAKSVHHTPLATGLRHLNAAERAPAQARRAEQLALLDSQFLNPKLCFFHETGPARAAVYESISPRFSTSLTFKFIKCLFDDQGSGLPAFPPHVSERRRLRYTATTLLHRKDYQAAIPILEELYVSGAGCANSMYPLYDEIVALLYDAYLQAEHVRKAVGVYVDNLLQHPLCVQSLDTTALHRLIERNAASGHAADIKIPIFFAATQANPQLTFVPYDNFLAAHGCKRPTELVSLANMFNQDLLIFFLSKVCTQKVIAGSFHFTGTADLEQERLQILQHLCRIDPDRRAQYAEEIDQITQRQYVRRGIQKVEEGRIHVDEEGIRRAGEKLLSENFRRYLDISSLKGIQALRLLDTNVMRVVLTNPGDKSAGEEEVVDINWLEAEGVRVIFKSHYALFKDLFLDVRERFISSSEYGLDSYLSVRIRHGTLQGQLRSRFEAVHLITQKVTEEGPYQPNLYWADALRGLSDEQQAFVQATLADLSQQVDRLTKRVKDEIIQIRTETRNPTGLFDFRFGDEDLFVLFTDQFESITSYPEFMDRVFAMLWARTEEGLIKIRTYLTEDLKHEFVHKLTEVQAALRTRLPAVAVPELHTAIVSGLTAVQNECDRIARWFTISGKSFEAFTLREIIDVCVASLNNVNPDVQISPEIDVDAGHISGVHFHAFFDILRTLLDNALRHSGITGGAPRIRIVGKIADTTLRLQMINSISSQVKGTDPVKRLAERVATIQTGAVSDEIKREGGTGYVKIAKILAYDLRRANAGIRFSYPTAEDFEVTLDFDGTGILQ